MGKIVRFAGPIMGTSWSASIVDAPAETPQLIDAVLAGVITQMSNWKATSDISRFNAAPVGRWHRLPADMMTVLRAGLDIAELSGGAFDPAVGRLVDRWGFGPGGLTGIYGQAHHPAPWTAIEVDGERARRTADVTLDFSGIAKGFAVDAIAAALRSLDLSHFLVEIGGELRGEGLKPDMQPWWIDAEAPSDLLLPALRVALCGLSIATSGDYRRYRQEGSVRLSHSINPKTGSPIVHDVAAVSVLHESAMLADAWATAITVLGHDHGMALATQHGLAVRLIRRKGSTGREYITPALAEMLD